MGQRGHGPGMAVTGSARWNQRRGPWAVLSRYQRITMVLGLTCCLTRERDDRRPPAERPSARGGAIS
jgi:hypothetical protein